MENEIWKDILGYEDRYQVSDQGRVRNKVSGQVLRPGLGGAGYYTVALYKDGKAKTKNVHELVAIAFLGERKRGMTVNHKDGNKQNNNLWNLEIVTYGENIRHAMDTGLNPHKKAIRIIETGEIFDSQLECAKAIGGDAANVSACLSGKINSHKGLHFERIDEAPKKKPFLYDYQLEAVERLKNGNILCGSVGSGKSRTGLFYYFKENGGWIDENGYVPMKNPQDLYIITTAKKRDSLEWQKEMLPFMLSTDPEVAYYKHKVVVDSWNNIGKYKDVKNSFFLLDEQRIVGSGAWVKTFLKLAKTNNWILLTATPGDTYMDYVPVFLANGFFKNRTEFNREHVIYSRFTKYPKVDRFIGTGRLDRLRTRVLVKMNYQHKIETIHEDIYMPYDHVLYKDTMRRRWDPYKDEPIINAAGLCYLLRKIVNSDPARADAVKALVDRHDKVIVFYSFDYELDILKNIDYGEDVEVAELNGHAHQPVPSGARWVYLVNYAAGAEAWECIKTNAMIFYSQHYSYKVMTQAAGRIDRLNSPYPTLLYYHLKSRSGIDLAISKALKEKKQFNESRFVKW